MSDLQAMPLQIKLLNSDSQTFKSELHQLLAFETVTDATLIKTVDDIIDNVRQNGDTCVLEYTQKFDNHPAQDFSELEIDAQQMQHAFENELTPEVADALKQAAKRIEDFHQHQVESDWDFQDEFGNRLGQKITPIEKVGIYVPGGLAAYPSSVLMNAIPAKVAGVKEVIMVVPAPSGVLNPLVLAAAYLAGVSRLFTIGGAQAVAALAYGTETVPKVDKITGPGNKYVAAAKRAVFGQVGIDMIAGPSEILVYAEGDNNADWLAMDLLSQAEHDTVAQSIFVTADKTLLEDVAEALTKLITQLPKKDIAAQALQARGALVLVANRQEAIEVINMVAPEHLELSMEHPEEMAEHITQAGAIFMGKYTPEAIGDYCAGPNHVLPTSGTARFSSPLGVYDFQKRTSIIHCSEQGSKPLAKIAKTLAIEENLHAHAYSAGYRAE